jgi:hypothetical protein
MSQVTAMTAARLAYQVWDDESGSFIAKFGTLDEAIGFLRGMLETNGESGVSDLAVIEYPSDGSAPITVLEGSEFLAQRPVPA